MREQVTKQLRGAAGHAFDTANVSATLPRESLLEAADLIDRIENALLDLSSMYAATWDRVDGALVMMPDHIPKFESAHRRARIALGKPLIDDEPLIPQTNTNQACPEGRQATALALDIPSSAPLSVTQRNTVHGEQTKVSSEP